jgi:hypothetical protein
LPNSPQTAGRRAGDKERAHLRRLEIYLRNFIAHYEDHREERFAPRTRQLVKESREVITELDALRQARGGSTASPDEASSDPQ